MRETLMEGTDSAVSSQEVMDHPGSVGKVSHLVRNHGNASAHGRESQFWEGVWYRAEVAENRVGCPIHVDGPARGYWL